MTDPALPQPSTLGRPIRQIALIVPDLEAGVRAYHDALGIGPWNVYTIGAPSMTGMTYRGEPADFRIWQEYLDARGASLHHIAFYVDDFEAATATMRERGWQSVQAGDGFGKSRDGRFTYYEHPTAIGIIVEVVKPPSERFAPEWTYPVPDAG